MADSREQLHLDDREEGQCLPATSLPAALVEFECDLIGAIHSFYRWTERSMRAAGVNDLSAVDALVLGILGSGTHVKGFAELSFAINMEDAYVVAYALRKLVTLGMVMGEKHGKETLYQPTPLGLEYLRRSKQVRDSCLLPAIHSSQINPPALVEMARHLRAISGHYDQAARAVSSN